MPGTSPDWERAGMSSPRGEVSVVKLFSPDLDASGYHTLKSELPNWEGINGVYLQGENRIVFSSRQRLVFWTFSSQDGSFRLQEIGTADVLYDPVNRKPKDAVREVYQESRERLYCTIWLALFRLPAFYVRYSGQRVSLTEMGTIPTTSTMVNLGRIEELSRGWRREGNVVQTVRLENFPKWLKEGRLPEE